MKVIDLTHTFDDAMPVYPGDPVPEISRLADIPGSGFTLTQVRTGMHTGTHMDGPLHMLENGKSLSEIPVEKFIGRGILIDARGKEKIDDTLLSGVHLLRNDIVLVLTGFSGKYRETAYYRDYPDMTESFAGALVNAGVSIVGLDTAGPDRSPFTIHRKLLSGDVLIIENLTNLESLLDISEFEVCALPPKFKTEAAPVRVIALVKETG
jgi:kynurenine formamidase